MFRIKLPTGEEAVYRTANELIQGVRTGLIGPGTTILHQASGQWLPIESHPHYQKARAAVAAAPPRRRIVPRQKAQLELQVPAVPSTGQKAPGPPRAPVAEVTAPQTKLRLVRPPQSSTARTAKPLASPPPGTSSTQPVAGLTPTTARPLRATPLATTGTPGRPSTPAPARPHLPPPDGGGQDATARRSPRVTAPRPRHAAATRTSTAAPAPTLDLRLEPVEASARRADTPKPSTLPSRPVAAVQPASRGDLPEGPVRRPLLTEEEATGLAFVESLKAAARNPRLTGIPSKRRTLAPTLFGHRPLLIGVAAMVFLALGRWVTVAAFTPSTSIEAGMVPPLTPVTPEEASAERASRRPTPAATASEPAEPATYEDAYAAAQGDVMRGLRSLRFDGLFSVGRLTDVDSLRTTRRDIAAAANVIVVYRSQEVRIDDIYDHPRPTQREPYAVVQTADSMFVMLDSVYTVLMDEVGGYRVSGGTMAFDRASAARRYARYRLWLRSHLGRWADRPSDTVPFTIGVLLRATAGGSLPPTR